MVIYHKRLEIIDDDSPSVAKNNLRKTNFEAKFFKYENETA